MFVILFVIQQKIVLNVYFHEYTPISLIFYTQEILKKWKHQSKVCFIKNYLKLFILHKCILSNGQIIIIHLTKLGIIENLGGGLLAGEMS